MKLKLQLIIESDTGEAEMVREVTKLERYALRPETLGLTRHNYPADRRDGANCHPVFAPLGCRPRENA